MHCTRLPLTRTGLLLLALLLAVTGLQFLRPTGRPTQPIPLAASTTIALPVAATTRPRTRTGAAGASPGSTLTVRLRRGDTLWAWSHRCHTTVASLQNLNALGHSTLVYPGRHLRVPAACRPSDTHRAAPAQPATNRSHPAAPTDHTTTAATTVTAVITYARAQLGKPYRWGAAGPAAFDCSGLTMRAWAVVGVRLPHFAADQAHSGVRVTRAALRPGDLVISNSYGHVQLYIGNGEVIQAPHTGSRVQISPLPRAGHVNAYVHLTAPARQ